jgi:hypothetical protein
MGKCKYCQSEMYEEINVEQIYQHDIDLGELNFLGLEMNLWLGKNKNNGQPELSCTLGSNDDRIELSVPITYCPFCGRKLVQS